MRSFLGVKSRLAIELSGWHGTPHAFLYLYRGREPVQKHRYYSAADIRRIRFDLIKQEPDPARPRTIPPIINFSMAKGGTGKTTISGNVAACMASYGHKVLMIDGDPQSSLTGSFGIDWIEQDVIHIGELMRRASSKKPILIKEAIVPIYEDGMLDLIPADITMAGTDVWMMQMLGREQAFTKLLEKEIEFFSQYDAIVIDSAPSSSLLTTSFMVASKTMLAVILPEPHSRKALDILVSNIQELNETFPGKDYGIHIIVNRYNQTKKPHQEEMTKLIERYKAYVDDVVVRDFVGFLRETTSKGQSLIGPIIEREPTSVGTRDIIDLTKNLIKFYGIKLAGQTGKPT